MEEKNLLIIGAGQYGTVARETAEQSGEFNRISFVDDVSTLAIGKVSDLDKLKGEYDYYFVAIGNAEVRAKLSAVCDEVGLKSANIVSPRAYVSPSARLMGGVIVEALAVVNSNSTIGKGCFICAGAVVNHDSTVGDFCQIDCNATVPARSVIEKDRKIYSR